MDCQNCGSPLDQAGETCAFCGTRSSALPAAEIPLAHQRGEGRTLTKTYDDSLQAIKSGIEYSAQVHEVEVRRSKIFLPVLMLLLGSPMILMLYLAFGNRPTPIDYEGCVTSGVAAVSSGDYFGGTRLLAEAVFASNEQAEPHLLLGSAYYAELLEKPHLDPRIRETRIYEVYREMNFARQVDPDNPRAHFFMALHYYEKSDTAKAITELEACLAHLTKISDEQQRKRYSDAATAILQGIKTPTKQRLLLYSQLDDSRNDQTKLGIEVPFGR